MRKLPTCPTCGKKYISNEVYEKHILTAHVQAVNEVQPVESVVTPVPAVESTDEIVLHFTKDPDITINGVHYNGKEIKVKSISLAAELVRLAREAYGPEVLA
jgi:hypothetical protein